jgi:hypothetical protein
MQGRSWRPLLANTAAPGWRQSFFCQYFLEAGFDTPTVLAARTTAGKLVKYPGNEGWTELFDLQQDAFETNNVFGQPLHQPTRAALEAEFDQLLLDTGLAARFGTPQPGPAGVTLPLTGGLGPRYQIEYGPDLQSWTPLQSVKMTGTQTNLSDPGTGFYRARMIAN